MNIPLHSSTRQWRQTLLSQHLLRHQSTLRLHELIEHTRASLLHRNQLLLALTAVRDAWVSLAPELQESDNILLRDGGQRGVVAAVVALPVRIAGNVTSRKSDGVSVKLGRDRPGMRVAELSIERDTRRAVGVDGEESSNLLPHANGADGVFLLCRIYMSTTEVKVMMLFMFGANLVDGLHAAGHDDRWCRVKLCRGRKGAIWSLIELRAGVRSRFYAWEIGCMMWRAHLKLGVSQCRRGFQSPANIRAAGRPGNSLWRRETVRRELRRLGIRTLVKLSVIGVVIGALQPSSPKLPI